MEAWEEKLLNLAVGALDSPRSTEIIEVEAKNLNRAFKYCERITKEHSKTFYLASTILPREKRRSVRALNAFCRYVDDLVDRNSIRSQEELRLWKQRLSEEFASGGLLATAWLHIKSRYGIPEGYVDQLIEGIARDTVKRRYNSFDELTEYCYGVASTVGLMFMFIVGFNGSDAIPYAIKLGIALQLTNILRDVGEDWNMGRLYLPLDELNRFNLSELDIQSCIIDDRWRSFMRYQIERCKRLYTEALPGISMLHPDGRLAVAMAAELYRAILNDIEANDYDVFHRRAYVKTYKKLLSIPAIWWRTKRMTYKKVAQSKNT